MELQPPQLTPSEIFLQLRNESGPRYSEFCPSRHPRASRGRFHNNHGRHCSPARPRLAYQLPTFATAQLLLQNSAERLDAIFDLGPEAADGRNSSLSDIPSVAANAVVVLLRKCLCLSNHAALPNMSRGVSGLVFGSSKPYELRMAISSLSVRIQCYGPCESYPNRTFASAPQSWRSCCGNEACRLVSDPNNC